MKSVHSNDAPPAVGPYSQAIEAGEFVFCSGQIGLDAKGTLVAGGVEAETKQVLKNLAAVLAAAGCDFTSVVSVNIYLKNMNDFALVNKLYGKAFANEAKPARVTVGVAALPKDALVEISCVAHSSTSAGART